MARNAFLHNGIELHLQEDPELKPMFEEMQKGGMPALMKYMNDPKWLAKVGEKLGDIPQGQQPPPITRQTAPPPNTPPEINTILDAAKWDPLLDTCWNIS